MTQKAAAAAPVEKAPEIDTSGWNDANLSIDGWYDAKTSGQIVGRALEAVQISTAFGPQDVVKVRLGRAADGIVGKGDDAGKVSLKAGDIMAVRISMNLTILLDMVENQCAVEITPGALQPTKNGKKIQLYKVKFKGTRARLTTSAKAQESDGATNAQAGDDDIPF